MRLHESFGVLRAVKHFPRRLTLAALLTILTLVAAVSAAACSDGDSGSTEPEVINALNILDKAGLHDIDTQISTNKTIPSNASTTFQQLQTVTLLTEWPTKDLQTKAKALAAIFGEAAAATDGANPDMAAAAAASKKAHDGEHDFAHEVWDHLYEKAGIKGADDAHGD